MSARPPIEVQLAARHNGRSGERWGLLGKVSPRIHLLIGRCTVAFYTVARPKGLGSEVRERCAAFDGEGRMLWDKPLDYEGALAEREGEAP